MQVHESQIHNYPKQIVGNCLMLNSCPTVTKCVYLHSFKLMATVGLSNHSSFFNFLPGSAYIVGKLVMHPCVPFRSGAPLTFLVHPRVHRAHRLKSTALNY